MTMLQRENAKEGAPENRRNAIWYSRYYYSQRSHSGRVEIWPFIMGACSLGRGKSQGCRVEVAGGGGTEAQLVILLCVLSYIHNSYHNILYSAGIEWHVLLDYDYYSWLSLYSDVSLHGIYIKNIFTPRSSAHMSSSLGMPSLLSYFRYSI